MTPILLSTLAPTKWINSNAFNRQQLFRRKELVHDSASEVGCVAVDPQVLRVLVVDDEKDTTDSLAWLVDRWGHVASLAYDGIAALRAAAAQRPDVVLLDIEMPFMDGCEVARHLRADVSRNECLIIAVTGRADHLRRQQCIEAGIDLLLIKPVNPSVVETLLLLENMRANRRRAQQADNNRESFDESGGMSC